MRVNVPVKLVQFIVGSAISVLLFTTPQFAAADANESASNGPASNFQASDVQGFKYLNHSSS